MHYVPIVSTALTIPFATEIFRRYRAHPDRLHLLWWAIGIATYGIGTFTEATTTIVGWNEPTFRAWYISGALLGGAPLAQGTVYLLLRRRTAHALTALLIGYVVIASVCVLWSPIDYSQVETHRLTGRVLGWQWVRAFSPVVNLYAVVFLIGGAILSALRYSSNPATRHRVYANVLIALGAILPGIGGTATRMGYVEVLYVTSLVVFGLEPALQSTRSGDLRGELAAGVGVFGAPKTRRQRTLLRWQSPSRPGSSSWRRCS